MPCTYEQHEQAMKDYMGPAFMGVGLPNALQPSWMANFTTGYPTFSNNMWNNYQNHGCSWWQNRVNHWTNQLSNNTYGPYQTQLIYAKITYAAYMASICCTPILHPIVIPSTGEAVPLVEKLSDDEEIANVSGLVDDLFVEYDKLDK